MKLATSLNSKFRLQPRLTFSVIRCDNSILPDKKSAIGRLSPVDLAAHVIVPVKQTTNYAKLSQETNPEWDRQLTVSRQLGSPCFSSPVLLSARERWHIHDKTSEIFDQAVVIDGAKRLEAAFSYPSIDNIPIAII